MNHLERSCESIDASVFSSDMLFDDERRTMLKSYIERWQRAIEEHEAAPAPAAEIPGLEVSNSDFGAWLDAGGDRRGGGRS